MPKRCSKCKQKGDDVRRAGRVQLCRKCREVKEKPTIHGRGDKFLPPELRAMARDMGVEDQLDKMAGGP